jgi:hypothetical protein
MTLASTSSQTQPRMSATRTTEQATLSGFGTMLASGIFPFNVNNFTTLWEYSCEHPNPGAGTQVGGPYDVKPYMYARLDVTTTGRYLINVRATASTAEMRRYTSAGTFDLVQAFGTPTTATGSYYSYPVLVELAAGEHHFYWTNVSQSVWVAEVLPSSSRNALGHDPVRSGRAHVSTRRRAGRKRGRGSLSRCIGE